MTAKPNRTRVVGAALLAALGSVTFLQGQDERTVIINGTPAGPAAPARVATAIAGFAPAAAAAAIPLGSGVIVGQAIEASSNQPVPGALVTLSMPGAAPLRVLADGQGRFAFTDLPKGSFGISATKGGYVAGSYGRMRPQGQTQTLALADGERVADAKIRLWRFGAVTGTVLDESGEPIVGATVRVLRKAILSGRPRLTPSATDTTDDRGMYRIGLLEPGDYIVCVPMTQGLNMTLDDMTRIVSAGEAGPLLTALASGGPGASFSYTSSDGGSTFNVTTAPSAGAGSAPAGQAYPTMFYPSALTASRAVLVAVVSGEERSGLDFQLQPLPVSRVSGTVTGPTGPGANLNVTLTPAQSGDLIAPMEAATTRTDGAGAFRFNGVPQGDYMLRVVSAGAPGPGVPGERVAVNAVNGQVTVDRTVAVGAVGPGLPPPPPPPPPPSVRGAAAWAEVSVSADRPDVAAINVVLQAGFKISGQLEWVGSATRPAAERIAINVTLEPADARTAAASEPVSGRVQTEGTFTTTGAVPGRYVVRVNGAPAGWSFRSAMLAGRDVADQAFDIDTGDVAGLSIVLADKTSDLSGTVTTADGASDDGVSVIVFPAEREAWSGYGPNPRRLRSIRTDKTGAYTAPNLPSGRYYVAAVHDSSAGDWQDEAFLASLASVASSIDVAPGAKATQNLKVAR
jgi:hypothetical protein